MQLFFVCKSFCTFEDPFAGAIYMTSGKTIFFILFYISVLIPNIQFAFLTSAEQVAAIIGT